MPHIGEVLFELNFIAESERVISSSRIRFCECTLPIEAIVGSLLFPPSVRQCPLFFSLLICLLGGGIPDGAVLPFRVPCVNIQMLKAFTWYMKTIIFYFLIF